MKSLHTFLYEAKKQKFHVTGEYGIQSGDSLSLTILSKDEAGAKKEFLKQVKSGKHGYIDINRIKGNIRIERV